MPAEPAAALLAGRYRLGATLGQGGMGRVLEAEDTRLRRQVAVKLLRADMADDPEIRRRFEVEASTAAQLTHPNAVTIFDTGEDDGIPFIVMERLPGRTVADELAGGAIAEERVRHIGGQVLDALGAAHGCGVLHRDIKPSNVLLTAGGDVKVADFGIAQIAEGHDATTTGLLLGTPAYLAPERLTGGSASPASDVYAVGVLLYETVSGRKPFEGDTPIAVAHAVHTTDPPPVAELRPGVDPALADVIGRAMAKDPRDRFRSAADMARALRGEVVPHLAAVRPSAADAPAGETVAEAAAGETAAIPIPATAAFTPAPRVEDPPPSDQAHVPARRRPQGPGAVERVRRRWPADPRVLAAAAVIVLMIVLAATLGGGGGGAPSDADTTSTSAPPPTLPPDLADAIDDLDDAVQP